ncbi:MAG: hypothetical protein WCT18_01160 [Patescibacteria group bacterium]
MSRLKWSFKKFVKFLECYGFTFGHVRGSHHFYNGRINGQVRVVQVIFSGKEKQCQSNRTIDMGIRHSGICRKYFEDWEKSGITHQEIIF